MAEAYDAGHPHAVSRVAAAAIVDAVDDGAVEAVAAAEMLLWRRGAVTLLRDLQLHALSEGWGGAAVLAACQALQQGGEAMVARSVLSTWLSWDGEEQASELLLQLEATAGDENALMVKVGRRFCRQANLLPEDN
jgi:hypothetical protein